MPGESPPPRQLPLSLPHRAALGRADFLSGAANAAAISLIDRWPDWPSRSVLLVGPSGSGKSHLVEIWREASGAGMVKASGLAVAGAAPLIERGALAIEDLHAGPIDEAALFHVLNLAAERKAAILMTSRALPSVLPLALADLASRLRAAQPVALAAPDDDLLRRVLAKLFADRQLTVDRAVIDYVVTRMERSLEAANRIVERLDEEALAEARPITTRLAATVLAPLFEHQADFRPEGN